MIPLATTTITATRPASGEDRYEPTGATSTVATAVPAHISSPSGSEVVLGGEQSRIDAVLLAEPFELDHYCTVIDDNTGDTYAVTWVRQRRGLGLDHTKAGLRVVQGAARV